MPLLDLFWTILYITLLIMWIWLVISIFGDILRSDKGGLAKAAWSLFVIVIPFLGVLIYMIANGDEMRQRNVDQAKAIDQAQREYIRSAAGTTSSADELAKLADLPSRGVSNDEEFARQKSQLLA